MSDLIPASSVDRRLLDGGSLFESPNELSARVNGQLTPAQAIKRLNDLLDSRDSYTDARQMKLLLYRAAKYMESLESDAINIGDPKARTTYLGTLRMMFDIIRESTKNVDTISTKLSDAHASFFAQAIMGAFQIVNEQLLARGITLTPEEALEITEAAAEEGVKVIEKYRENDA